VSGSAVWDYSSHNWVTASGAPSLYSDSPSPGVATFGDSYNPGPTAVINTNVIVQSGGVTPALVTFTNTGGSNGGVDYTFSDNDGVNGIGGGANIIVNGGAA